MIHNWRYLLFLFLSKPFQNKPIRCQPVLAILSDLAAWLRIMKRALQMRRLMMREWLAIGRR
jgi:hypothetical protein